MEAEIATAQNQRDESIAMAGKFDKIFENPGDIVNKAKLYDKGMTKLGALPGPKIVQFLVDYNAKMKKVLARIWAIRQDHLDKQLTQPETQSTTTASTSRPQPDSQLPNLTL